MPRPSDTSLVGPRRLREFGLRLKQLRTWRHLTQESLADKAGLSAQYIARLEQGRMSPGLLRLWDLADALGIRPAELLEEDFPASWKVELPAGGRDEVGS